MSNDKMREEFEAWLAVNVRNFNPQIDLARDGDGDYRYEPAAAGWETWQASREALVIEWPDQHTYTVPDVAGAAILDCRTSYSKALGLKVKS